MGVTFKLRRGHSDEWMADNPVLSAGEPGLETDTGLFKIGDGVASWTNLPYYLNEETTQGLIQAAIDNAVIEGVEGPQGPPGPPGDPASSGMDQIFPIAHYGLVSASGDPLVFMTESSLGNDGAFYTRLWIPANKSFTKLWAAVRVAGVSDDATSGNRLALFDGEGVLVDTTASNTALWTSTGWVGGPLQGGTIASQTTGRFVYVGIFCRGMTTSPRLAFVDIANDFASMQTGPGTSKRRNMFASGTTSVPSSFDPSSHGSPTGFVPLLGID